MTRPSRSRILPRGARIGRRFDAVALGLLAVDVRAFDLQAPEAGDQEQKDGNRQVLE